MNYGYHPRTPTNMGLESEKVYADRVPAANEFVYEWQALDDYAYKCLSKAQDRMKDYADQFRRPVEYKVGDQVLLRSINLTMPGCRKFLPKYVGPFTVTKIINMNAYKLALPEKWRIADVFNVSLLKPYNKRPDQRPLNIPDILDDRSYVVDSILEHNMKPDGTLRFKVSYKEHESIQNTWESEHDLTRFYPQLVSDYKKLHNL